MDIAIGVVVCERLLHKGSELRVCEESMFNWVRENGWVVLYIAQILESQSKKKGIHDKKHQHHEYPVACLNASVAS